MGQSGPRAVGALGNTYGVYTSDRGRAIGRHGLQGKQNLYAHTWRVPFLAKGPGIAAGVRAPGNIYLLDVLATLCELAGVEPPATSEGISFKAVLEGRKQREVDPTLETLRECLTELAETEPSDSFTKQRLEDMLDFFETMTSGYGQIRSMSQDQLKRLTKLGSKLQKLLG